MAELAKLQLLLQLIEQVHSLDGGQGLHGGFAQNFHHFGLSQIFSLGSTLGKLILCGVPVLVGVVVYVVCVVAFKAITREDCMLLPKGEKIAKLLHL